MYELIRTVWMAFSSEALTPLRKQSKPRWRPIRNVTFSNSNDQLSTRVCLQTCHRKRQARFLSLSYTCMMCLVQFRVSKASITIPWKQ
jgi:hypothetical protein